ncbi:MAG TPA: hypothetical protein VMM77_09315 [Gemmatimonadaceae bacterium]|nr:hypothetical protein [Gemmatimonadaceae bacterium]
MRNIDIRFIVAVAYAILTAASPAIAQSTRIGIIDVYGASTVGRDAVRKALALSIGDTIPQSFAGAETRLRAIPGVADAEVSAVCCANGRMMVFAGVRESGAPALEMRPAPTGTATLPDAIIAADAAFTAALRDAVEQGQASEDHSAGHALMEYAPARAVQQRFIELAGEHEAHLRLVLRDSRFPMQRALAATVLGYLPDKREAAQALAPALADSSSAVRNDAARALWIIAEFAKDSPAIRSHIPIDPLVNMLQSLTWTDRNKASLVLMALTATNDSALLATLQARALPELMEMALWQSSAHALAPLLVLGRIGGVPDDEILAAWAEERREEVLRRAIRG